MCRTCEWVPWLVHLDSMKSYARQNSFVSHILGCVSRGDVLGSALFVYECVTWRIRMGFVERMTVSHPRVTDGVWMGTSPCGAGSSKILVSHIGSVWISLSVTRGCEWVHCQYVPFIHCQYVIRVFLKSHHHMVMYPFIHCHTRIHRHMAHVWMGAATPSNVWEWMSTSPSVSSMNEWVYRHMSHSRVPTL